MAFTSTPRRAARIPQCLAVAVLTTTSLVSGPTAANADASPVPPNLSGIFLIENAGWNTLMCANASGNLVSTLVSTHISPDCQWQQSGPDFDAVLYNVGMNEVLDINGSGPLSTNTTMNLQPYYTNPLQTYEQWSWSGFGWGGQALRPYDDSDLNVAADSYSPLPQPVSLDRWDTSDNNAQFESWYRAPLSQATYPPVTMPTNPNPPTPIRSNPFYGSDILVQNAGFPGYALCADANDTGVYVQQLSQDINGYCVWQIGRPNGTPSGTFYLYNPAKDLVLDINGSGSLASGTGINLQPYYTNPLQTYEWWTFSSNTGYGYGAGAEALHPYWYSNLNLNGQFQGIPSTNQVQSLTITDWDQPTRQTMSWVTTWVESS